MSAPLFDARHHLVGALTISGVASRWNRDRMFLAGQAVKQAAEEISRELGHHAPPDATAAAQLQDPDSRVYRLFSEMCDETWQPNLAESSWTGSSSCPAAVDAGLRGTHVPPSRTSEMSSSLLACSRTWFRVASARAMIFAGS